ncbi:hypothetical protein [Kutzneria albida]|uniref:IrrE N-terminal-like domain-containing protein n=1 Tax=Kutzneria albida DSM 43870 TaxID=1449976 RepID=W5W3G7_9PSEU|nr:hypothetical protein [Kutzneria albida]AHH95738.1 hypothetical protein KALB_2370 [Kutzneria albida DSM 43870]
MSTARDRRSQPQRGRASDRELQRRCRRLLRELDIQPPLDISELCARLGRQRGRPIKLISYPIPADGPFGLWLRDETTDYIVYQRHTTEPHQKHIILHEVGHILADHPSDEDADDLAQLLNRPKAGGAGQLPDTADGLRRRTAYDQREEHEAETVATIILEWASVLDILQLPSAPGPAEEMDAALGERLGWL